MRASACIGRVGGLAVALGVGAAIATGGTGLAWGTPAGDQTSTGDTVDAGTSRPHNTPTRRAPAAQKSGARNNETPAAASKRAGKALPQPVSAQRATEVPLPTAAPAPATALSATAAVPGSTPLGPVSFPAPTAPAPALRIAAPAAAMMVAPIADAVESALRSLAYGPGSPAQSSANWAMLAAVRRLGRQQVSVDPTAGAMTTSSAVASATGGDPFSGAFFNQTPTLSPAKVDQSATGVVTGSLNGVDPDSSPLSYTVTAAPAHGSLTVDGSGHYTYTPDADLAHGGYTDSFQVTVSDADTGLHVHGLMGLLNLLTFGLIGESGHTTTSTVSVTVAAVNKPPTASLTAGAPNPLTGVVLGTVTASDADADALTYSALGATKGAVAFGAGGSFTYTPTATARHTAASLTATAADKADNFSIVVNDGHTGTVTLPMSVSIVPANAAPTATPSAGSPNPSTGVVAGSLNPVDADGDSLAYVAAGATKGAVSFGANGTFTYTPTAAARHNAAALDATAGDKADSFTVTVSDGHGGSIAVPVAVAIAPANAAPATVTTVGAPNGSTGVVLGAVSATDADSDPLTITGSTSTGKGAVVVAADGSFTYTPTSTARHNAASVTATAADKTDTFTVTVSDGHGAPVAVPVVVALGAANTAPATSSSVGSPDVSTGVVTGTVTATDADSDPLTYSAAGAGKGAVVVDAGGGFTYTPTEAARHQAASATATQADQADSFTITVNDGHGGAVAVPISVAIASINSTPATGSVVGAPNPSTGVVTGSVIAADADGDPLTYLASTPGRGAVVVAANGTFTYTPTATARHIAASVTATDAHKADGFTITVSDGHGGSVAVPISVAVGPANTDPATSSTVGTPDGAGVVTGSVHATDADGDALSYTGSSTGKGTVVVAADGTFTYTPTAAARHNAASVTATAADKSDTFTVTVADGHGGSVDVPVTVAITGANAAPTIASSTVGTPDATTGVVAGAVLGADADSDPLTYAAAGSGKGSVAFSSGGSFTYTPTATARHNAASLTATDADKSDAFTVTVSDGHGGTVAVPISVVVAPENAAPTGSTTVGNPDATSGLVAGAVLGVDGDTDPLTYTATGATKGAVTLNANGTFTYTPTTMARHNAFLQGATVADKTDTFTVTVSDGHGGSVAVPVTVTIAPAGVTFTFNYGSGSNYWSNSARTALNTAAVNLASYIVVAAPVTVTYDVIGQNNGGSTLLASASASFTGVGAGYNGTVIQTKVLTGTDYNGSAADSTITWNFAHSWDYDNNIGNRAYDFQAVALHELLHSFGFLTGVGDPASPDRNWSTYDKFLTTSGGTKVIDANYNWISAYSGNLTGSGGGLYFAGPTVVAVYGGPVQLYTPSTWASGSSVSHLDPTNPSADTQVMNPSENYGPGVRTISDVELAILTDLGYTVSPAPVLAFVFITIGVVRRRRN